MENWTKYVMGAVVVVVGAGSAYAFPANSFIAFVVGWLFLIPAVFGAYMLHGLWKYMQERKNQISVIIKPANAMKSIARREEALRREKELLYSEIRNEMKK